MDYVYHTAWIYYVEYCVVDDERGLVFCVTVISFVRGEGFYLKVRGKVPLDALGSLLSLPREISWVLLQ